MHPPVCPPALSSLVAIGALLAGVLLAAAARAQGPPAGAGPIERAPGAARPTIGLVLSGGGARGAAHLGVLRVLERLQVPVDIVVGTSAGAIVGAAYASGMPLDEIDREMTTLNTSSLVRDVDRTEIPLHRKADDATNYVGPEIGLGPQGVGLPKGALAGVSVEAVLRRLTQRQRNADFDRLPIRYRAIATDLTNSEMVVIGHGSLATAIRASMALPAVIDPVELDGRLLVDGGVARNLPIDVARQLGAEIVIAVNIGTPLRTREEITSIFSVSDQLLRILTANNVQQSLRELGPRDVLITPDLGTVTTADFDRLAEAAQTGVVAAEAVAPQLAALAVSPSSFAAWRAVLNAADDLPHPVLADVQVSGTRQVNPDTVIDAMRSRPGETFDPRTVDQDLKRIYGHGDFERVSYTLTEEAGIGHVLTADVTERSWGPHYLRFGLGLSSDFEGNSLFNVIATHRLPWVNRLGGAWRNDLQIGQTDRLATEFRQPLTTRQRMFVAARAAFAREPFDLYVERLRIGRYRRQTIGVGLDVGAPLGSWGEWRLGYSRGDVRLLTDTGVVPGSLLVPNARTGGLLTQLRIDTLDNLRFPRSGVQAGLRVLAARDRLGATDSFTKVNANVLAATARGAHSLQLGLRLATSLGDDELPPYELDSLGGFLRLSGYKTGELLASELAFGRLVYNYRVTGPAVLDGAYLGASAEFGRLRDAVNNDDVTIRRALSLYFALDTPLGPLYLAYGRASGGSQAVYLYLGQP